MADNGDKTEKATPKRKREARKKGTVLQSKEVVTVASLAATFLALQFLIPITMQMLEQMMQRFLSDQSGIVLDVPGLTKLTADCIYTVVVAALPICLVAAMVSIAATMAQTRGLFTMKAAAPKMSRLNPLQGLKKLISMQGLMELVKSLLKIAILGIIVYLQIKDAFPKFARLMDMSLPQAMATVGDLILGMVWTVCAIFVFVAAFDFLFQWWQFEKNLRMSKQELKEEYKETEGDPQIKGKIKERQQAMSRRRMMQQVPQADVVIRNPTHFAIAIRYRPEEDVAPVVLAKGADALALRIVKAAEEAGVYITENRPLARGLYDAVEIDDMVPVEFYRPVAEVLAFVYNLREKQKAQGGSSQANSSQHE